LSFAETFGENIRLARERAGLTQQQVADRLGITNSTYCGYEIGRRNPNPEKLKELARILNTPSDVILGTDIYADNTGPFPTTIARPRLGSIACGEPILAEENIQGYDPIPDYIKCDFTLICQGDSMIGARIFDGDLVCIKQQPTVENGQIAAVSIDGDEATLKRFYLENGTVTLVAENPAYPPKTFTREAANRVRVLGLATHFISSIK